MKRILIISALLLAVAFTATADRRRLMMARNVAAASPTYLIEEGFEEVDTGGALGSGTDGYDSALAAAETGTPNNDYATAPAPLVGSRSLYLDSSAAVAQAVRWDLAAAQSELWMYFKFSDASLPMNSSQPICEMVSSGGVTQGGVYLRTASNFKVVNGTILSTETTGTVSASTTYHLWVHWKNDGTGDVGFSTDGVRPTSGNNYQTVTGGDGTSTVTRIYLRASDAALQTMIVDRFLVSTSVIGDNP